VHRTHRITRHLLVILVGLPGATPVFASDRVVVSDVLRERTITAIDIAEDSLQGVFTVRSIVEDEPGDDETPTTWQYVSHLYGLDLTTPRATPLQLTWGERRDADPAVSPNGSTVAFVRADDEDTPQIWLLPLRGGEARQLTSLEHGATNPQWSPDGSRLIVSSSLPMSAFDGSPPYPAERAGRDWNDVDPSTVPDPDGSIENVRAWLHRNAMRADPAVIHRIAFQDELSLRGEPTVQQLFLVDVDSGDSKRISPAYRACRDATFLPDGRRIVFVTTMDHSRHPDRVRATQISTMSIDGTDERVLVDVADMALSSPTPSRDGSVLAFTGQRHDAPVFRPAQLGIVPLDAGGDEVIWLTDGANLDRSVRRFRWLNSSSGLVLSAERHGGVPLLTVSTGLLEPIDLVSSDDDGAPIGVHVFDQASGTLLYTVTSPTNPCVLRVRDARGDRVVFHPNEWLEGRRLSTPMERTIERPDGTMVQYWVMPPIGFDERSQYPVMLQIHGGPSSMWGPGERTMWHEFQYFCAQGYAVVYANPRGSGGYGEAFRRGNFQNWGQGPADDVLAALDHALTLGWLDADRMVVTGGSYGGYLTAWIVGNDHRFKAAAAQRGVYELVTFFGEGNAWRLLEWAMGGPPWDARIRPILRRESPFTYVQRIRTPLLILHASNDLRTGVSQSEMMYRALKELERPVEYVRYPNAGHDLSRTGDPTQRIDRLLRMHEWFARFISF